jgi:hypothetical protein
MKVRQLVLSAFAFGLVAAATAAQATNEVEESGFLRGYIVENATPVVVLAVVRKQEYLGSLGEDDPSVIVMDGRFKGHFRVTRTIFGEAPPRKFETEFVAHTYYRDDIDIVLLLNVVDGKVVSIRGVSFPHDGKACFPTRIVQQYGMDSVFNLAPSTEHTGLCARL